MTKRGGCRQRWTLAMVRLKIIESAAARQKKHPSSTFSLPCQCGLSEGGTLQDVPFHVAAAFSPTFFQQLHCKKKLTS